MLPTARSIMIFAAGMPVMLALTLHDPGAWWWGGVFIAGWIGVLLLDAILSVRWVELQPDFVTPRIGYIGDVEAVQISLTGKAGNRALPIEVICDVTGDAVHPEMRQLYLDGGRTRRFEIPIRPLRRGQIMLEKLWFRWAGPLGMVRRVQTVPLGRTYSVVPNIRAVQRAALNFYARDAFFGQKPQSQQGDGSEFSALREYVPGLDHRSIDWKQTAKHRVLTCKEFETERNHQIIIAFDTGHLMSEPVAGVPKLDHAINAGLLLGFVCTRMGDRVGTFAFDAKVRQYNAPTAGSRGFQRLQAGSAELAYQTDETNFTLGLAQLTSRLNRRSLVIVMTDFIDTTTAELMTASIGRLARRHLVIFIAIKDPDLTDAAEAAPASSTDMARSVVAAGIADDRRIVLEKLHRMGVHCIDARPEEIGVQLVNEYLSVKQRDML